MKRKVEKILLCLIVIITIFNLFCTNVSKATSPAQQKIINSLQDDEEDSLFEDVWGLGYLIDGLVGFFSKVIQIPFLLIGLGVEVIFTEIAKIGRK